MACGSLIFSGGFVSSTIASIEQNRGQELASLLSLRQLWCSASIPYSLPRTAQLTGFVTITFIYLFSGGHVHAMTHVWMAVRGLLAESLISLITGLPGVNLRSPGLLASALYPLSICLRQLILRFIYFYFMYMSILPSCMVCVPSVCLVPMKARRGCQTPLNLQTVVIWVLRIEPQSSLRAVRALNNEPSLQPQFS